MNIPRNEHPNPQFERENWVCLNGKWEFEIDKSNSGKARKLYEVKKLNSEIIVPFCPESKLSGIGETDFLNSVWYKKDIEIKSLENNVVIHIGACDYFTTVYVNSKEVGTHEGGYTPISFDITKYLNLGKNTIVINATDDNSSFKQPCGKQSMLNNSNSEYNKSLDGYDFMTVIANPHLVHYTRTTGIWQSVYLEYVPKTHIDSVKYYPDYKNARLNIKALVTGDATFSAIAYYNGKVVGEVSLENCGRNVDATIDLTEKHLWEAGNGRLYDLELFYGEDKVKSYFGLRNLSFNGYKFMLNGKSVFQRLVLDQGYYPDGIYTAPTKEDMINDIKISQDAGFNGARLHEKVFEPRFLYYCDKMGYLIWGEYANWGLDHTDISLLPVFLKQWQETLERDFNHPSIVGWCPFNETWNINGRRQSDEMIESVYKMTKLLDTTRPCIDTSGNFHVITDIYDIHDYCQNVEEFKGYIDEIEKNNMIVDQTERNVLIKGRQKYKGEPIFVSEYGGIKWDMDNSADGWGYGDSPKNEEEFIARYKGLTEAIIGSNKIFGLCYTQLYDVEHERNGLYTYHRKPKFDMNIIKEITSQKAKIED